VILNITNLKIGGETLIKEAICTAPTIEEATSAAIEKLNAPDNADITVEIMQEPVKKTFGLFGGSPAKVRVYYQQSEFAKAEDYIRTILEGIGIQDAEIETDVKGEDVRIEIKCGNDYGAIIGRRGETLDAIQYLTRLIINKGSEDYKRVSINVGNYREKREQTLKELAKRTASKVKKYGRSLSLDPMNPYERRIIHTTIQAIEGVTSHSVGNESNRKVIVTPADGYKSSSGGNNRDERPNGGYRQGAGWDKRSHGNGRSDYRSSRSSGDNNPSRTPRSDAASATLYGRIDTKKED
jgi:spoIIIJ-associated protein